MLTRSAAQLYLPATYAVYTLLTEQRALLLKSIFNASALYTLNVADVELDLPPSTFTDFAERTTTRPSIRSDETKCSGRPLSAKRPTSSRSSNSADIGVQHDDVTEKLKTVVVNRKLVILQAVVTESMALGLLGFSIFNACNGMQHVSLAQGRIIYILVPTYSFLAVRSPSSPPQSPTELTSSPLSPPSSRRSCLGTCPADRRRTSVRRRQCRCPRASGFRTRTRLRGMPGTTRARRWSSRCPSRRARATTRVGARAVARTSSRCDRMRRRRRHQTAGAVC